MSGKHNVYTIRARQDFVKGVDTLLVAYDIKIGYSTETVTLFLEMFNLDPFVIPQGFACAWSFE